MECEKVLTILQQRIKAMEYEKKVVFNQQVCMWLCVVRVCVCARVFV
jgi:hypothetical protein